MHSAAWLRYFTANRHNFIEPDWPAPIPLTTELRSLLARSLSHFQLGESGGGQHLFGKAGEQEEAYRAALKLFVAEEAEHARLLQGLVIRFGGRLIKRHWTHLLFRTARRALGLNFEIQVLLIAELVGTAYYRMLHRRARDPILDQVCERILADEAQHVAFHLDRLRDIHAALLPAERAAWSLQFQLLFSAALLVAWVDHRVALGAIGTRRAEFFAEARKECIGFLDALRRWPNESCDSTGDFFSKLNMKWRERPLSGERTRLACWFRRPRRNRLGGAYGGRKSSRWRGAIASTRGACAPQNPAFPPSRL